jgi:hypothetical protein
MSEHYFMMASYYVNDTGQPWNLKFPISNGLALTNIELRVTIGNLSWDNVEGEFSEDVFSHPRTLSNVDNGFGFVASGYNQQARLLPSTSAVGDTWFFDYVMRSSDGCSDYCACGQF